MDSLFHLAYLLGQLSLISLVPEYFHISCIYVYQRFFSPFFCSYINPNFWFFHTARSWFKIIHTTNSNWKSKSFNLTWYFVAEKKNFENTLNSFYLAIPLNKVNIKQTLCWLKLVVFLNRRMANKKWSVKLTWSIIWYN